MSYYGNISALQPDIAKHTRQSYLDGQPWKFVNLLPIPVKIYITSDGKLSHLANIPPRETYMASTGPQKGSVLRADDVIHVIYTSTDGKDYEILRPESLIDDSRIVNIGSIVYDEKHNNYFNSHNDISGIRINNRLSMPIEIYYHNMKIGETMGDDGMDYNSGSKNSVYLDNNYKGFRLGDELKFVLKFNNKEIGTVMLYDNYIKNIYVGVINQKFTPPSNDTFAYRIDSPSYTGITYFEPIGGSYTTHKTNPRALN
jgi:hypothetical protein